MKKINISILAFWMLSVWAVCGQSQSQNYIRTRIYRNDLGSQYNETINYIDGIGRRSQTVNKGITPTGKDLVSLDEYDNTGRVVRQWLPVVSDGSGNYVPPTTIKATQSIYGSDSRHYTENIYEASSAGRILETYGPGQAWFDNGRSVKTTIHANNATDSLSAICYTITGSLNNVQLVKKGNYATNELLVTRTLDEDGRSSLVFTTKTGQTIMTRQINVSASNQREFLDTYYVYDLSENLMYVLPPMVDNSLSAGAQSDDNDVLKKYAYVFKYDDLGMCIRKRLPGADWTYYVYDNSKRPVFTQDGAMRAKHHWQYSVYDNHDRIIAQSNLYSTASQESLISAYRGRTNYIPYIESGMTNLFIPSGNTSMQLQDSVYYAVYGNNMYTYRSKMEPLELFQTDRIAINSDWASIFENLPPDIYEQVIPGLLEGYNQMVRESGNGYFLENFTINEAFSDGYDSNNRKCYFIPLDYHYNNLMWDFIDNFPFVFELISKPSTSYVGPIYGMGIPKIRNEDLTVPSDLSFLAVSGVVATGDKAAIRDGLLTYERIKVLDNETTNSYIERAYYYDNKSRLIQLVEKGIDGVNRVSYKYDFVGNPLIVLESQSVNGINTDVRTHFAYDNAGRMSTEKVYVNNVEQASLTYNYDELGRLTAKEYAKGTWSTTETMAYNIRGWLAGKSGSYFSMQLKYHDALHSSSTKLYGGGVSEWTWQHGTSPNNMYSFKYDNAARLTGVAQYVASGSSWGLQIRNYLENGITYDKNGNILKMLRSAAGATVDNLTYTYTGNRLTGLSEIVNTSPATDVFAPNGTTTGNYTYDPNGNMITDSRKNLNFTYNFLNLLSEVRQGSTVNATYKWSGDGTKLSVRDEAGTNGYDYSGLLCIKRTVWRWILTRFSSVAGSSVSPAAVTWLTIS